MTQKVDHLARGHLLGIEEVVDAHVDEHLLVVGFEVLVVVDAGNGLLGPELLGHDRRQHILVLVVVHGDKEVATAHSRTPQHGKCRRVTLDGDQIDETAQLVQLLRVAVDDRDVVSVAAQHLRQVAPHLAYARNYYLHTSEYRPHDARLRI